MNLKKLERYLRVNLLGPGPRVIKKVLPDRGLTKVEKHCLSPRGHWDRCHHSLTERNIITMFTFRNVRDQAECADILYKCILVCSCETERYSSRK